MDIFIAVCAGVVMLGAGEGMTLLLEQYPSWKPAILIVCYCLIGLGSAGLIFAFVRSLPKRAVTSVAAKLVPIWKVFEELPPHCQFDHADDLTRRYVQWNRAAYGIREQAAKAGVTVYGRQYAADLILPIAAKFWEANEIQLTAAMDEQGMSSSQTSPTNPRLYPSVRYRDLHLPEADLKALIAVADRQPNFGNRSTA